MPPAALVWRTGVAITATGITAGAFGAHTLKSRLGGEKSTNWTLASSYATFNGVALLAISHHPRFGRGYAPLAIAAGTLMFSGSIYALLLIQDSKLTSKIAGPMTPVGGLFLIGGYLAMLF